MYIKIEIFDDKTRDVCHQIWSSFFKPPGHTLTQPSVDFETLQSVINSSILFHWVECSKSFNFFFFSHFGLQTRNKTRHLFSPHQVTAQLHFKSKRLLWDRFNFRLRLLTILARSFQTERGWGRVC